MKTLILGFLLPVVLLFACAKEPNEPSENHPTSNRFPGFTKAANLEPGSSFFVDPKSIKRQPNQVISFKLLQLLPDGYAIQDAQVTGLENQNPLVSADMSFESQDGLKYSNSGTSQGKFAGISLTVDNQAQPGLAAVISFIRGQLRREEAIIGKFDDRRAVEILYGAYRPDLNGVPRTDVKKPNGEPFPSQPISRAFLTKEYEEDNQKKCVLIVTTNSDDNNCHACSPLVSAAIFCQHGNSWELESEYQSLDVPGQDGQPGECSWQAIGKEKYALIVKCTDGNNGSFVTMFQGIQLGKQTATTILTTSSDFTDNDGIVCTLSFEKSTKDYWDAILNVSHNNALTKVATTKYIFKDGTYAPPNATSATIATNTQTSVEPLSGTTTADSADLENPNDLIENVLKAEQSGDSVSLAQKLLSLSKIAKPNAGDGNQATLLNKVGLAALKAKKYGEAVTEFKAAAIADPSDPKYKSNLGYAETYAGSLGAAESDLYSSIAMAPYRSVSWGDLGLVLAKKGEQDRAVSALLVGYQVSHGVTIGFLKSVASNTQNDDSVQAAATTALAKIQSVAPNTGRVTSNEDSGTSKSLDSSNTEVEKPLE